MAAHQSKLSHVSWVPSGSSSNTVLDRELLILSEYWNHIEVNSVVRNQYTATTQDSLNFVVN